MKLKLLFILLMTVVMVDAQNYIFGKVTNEDGIELSQASVINMITDERTATNADGQFMIRANLEDEVRFSRTGYERLSIKVDQEHFSKSVTVVLVAVPTEIEEVKLRYQPTGNLKEDVKHFRDRGKVKVLKDDVAEYVARKSAPEVLAPRHGEFVQPVGPGFSIGRVKDHWDDVDLMEFLIKSLGEDFFTEELKISRAEIQPFIYYVFANFERKQALKYGAADASVLARFVDAANNQIYRYRNGESPPTKVKQNKR